MSLTAESIPVGLASKVENKSSTAIEDVFSIRPKLNAEKLDTTPTAWPQATSLLGEIWPGSSGQLDLLEDIGQERKSPFADLEIPVSFPFRPEIPSTTQAAEFQEGSLQEGWSSSTTRPRFPYRIDHEIDSLFREAREEVFEDGTESEFSKNLAQLISRYGNAAIAVLTRLIIAEQVDGEVASEALRLLGRIDHPSTYRGRLWLLERCLYCSSPWVRDGAVLGLAWLDDPQAVLNLRRAIERERIVELREDMGKVLSQLESIRNAEGF